MIEAIKHELWQQVGASIDMLAQAIDRCPDEFLAGDHRFYHLAFHSLIYLDYYLTLPPKDFVPTLPFTIVEQGEIPAYAVGDMIPDRTYTRIELSTYLAQSRLKAQALIDQISEKGLTSRFTEEFAGGMDYPLLEIILYNLRHLQHHVGQLYLLLRQDNHSVPPWAFQAKE